MPDVAPTAGDEDEAARKTEWIEMGSEVRGVSVDSRTAELLREHDSSRPCATLLDRYVACVEEYNIELCDDEKFLYRKCIREFIKRTRGASDTASR